MSFGSEARKVRDGSLPYGRRVRALAKCVELYRPLGYPATFHRLEEVAGRYRCDEAALIRAVDALDASRRLWLAEQTAYARRRTIAKRRGDRSPPPDDRGPGRRIWYGDQKRAALSAIRYELTHRGDGAAPDPAVARLGQRLLDADGVITAAQYERAAQIRVLTIGSGGWVDVEFPDRSRTARTLWLLHLIFAVAGAPRPDQPG
jgi:hypothetical protein